MYGTRQGFLLSALSVSVLLLAITTRVQAEIVAFTASGEAVTAEEVLTGLLVRACLLWFAVFG